MYYESPQPYYELVNNLALKQFSVYHSYKAGVILEVGETSRDDLPLV